MVKRKKELNYVTSNLCRIFLLTAFLCEAQGSPINTHRACAEIFHCILLSP